MSSNAQRSAVITGSGYFSARNLRNKLLNLHNILYSNFYHVICIVESWLDDGFLNGLLDPKCLFNIVRFNRSNDKSDGRVCVFILKNIQVIPIVVDDCYSDVEMVSL